MFFRCVDVIPWLFTFPPRQEVEPLLLKLETTREQKKNIRALSAHIRESSKIAPNVAETKRGRHK